MRLSTLLAMMLALPSICSRKQDADAGADASAVASKQAAGDAAVRGAVIDAGDDGAAKAANERGKELLADIRRMVAKGTTIDPTKAGEGDLASKCDAIESMRSDADSSHAAEPTPRRRGDPSHAAEPNAPRHGDPELTKTLDEAATLCAFDVPLVTASEALDRLRTLQSQASRRFLCDVASREIAKARSARPTDPRIRRVDARRIETCR